MLELNHQKPRQEYTAKSGLIVLLGGLTFLFGGMYLDKALELQSFSKANDYFVQGYDRGLKDLERVPMQGLFP